MKPELQEKSGSSTRNYTELYNDAPFNFVQDLKLEEEVSVSSSYSNVGIFPAGVIQYAFTYGYKYGQESKPLSYYILLSLIEVVVQKIK